MAHRRHNDDASVVFDCDYLGFADLSPGHVDAVSVATALKGLTPNKGTPMIMIGSVFGFSGQQTESRLDEEEGGGGGGSEEEEKEKRGHTATKLTQTTKSHIEEE